MSLLNPIALAWAAVAVPIVALYILKIRRRRHVVPTLMFWDQLFQDAAPRSLWRRLRHWLSLLMQLAFLLLLVMALADPVWSGVSRRPTHWIVVVDQSASMQAADGAPTRFDQAKSIVHGTIRAMRTQDQATLIAARGHASIACGRTHHQPTLHKTVDTLTPIDAPCDLAGALRLARSIDVGDEARKIVLVTDAPGAAGLGDALHDDDVTVERCGGATANVGITGFAVRPRSDNPLELQGMVRVGNFGDEPKSVEIRLTRDEQLFDVISLKLAAGEESLRTFHHVHATGHVLRADLSEPDALMIDNATVAVLPEIKAIRVALVTEGNVFLESVLAVHPWLDATKVAPAEWSDAADEADIVVFDEFVPPSLPAKPCLFIHPGRPSPLWSLGDELKNPLVSDLIEDAALLRHVNLRNCTLLAARSVTPKGKAVALASSFEHPLLLAWAEASPPKVLFAADVRKGDLPLRTAFPILMQNTLNYLTGKTDEPVSAYRTGHVATVVGFGDGATVCDPNGHSVPVGSTDGQLLVGPVLSCGMVTVEAGDRSVDLAFNLADSGESDIRRGASGAASSDGRAVLARSSWSWPWWVVLAMTAIGLSTLEWCLHQRRRID